MNLFQSIKKSTINMILSESPLTILLYGFLPFTSPEKRQVESTRLVELVTQHLKAQGITNIQVNLMNPGQVDEMYEGDPNKLFENFDIVQMDDAALPLLKLPLQIFNKLDLDDHSDYFDICWKSTQVAEFPNHHFGVPTNLCFHVIIQRSLPCLDEIVLGAMADPYRLTNLYIEYFLNLLPECGIDQIDSQNLQQGCLEGVKEFLKRSQKDQNQFQFNSNISMNLMTNFDFVAHGCRSVASYSETLFSMIDKLPGQDFYLKRVYNKGLKIPVYSNSFFAKSNPTRRQEILAVFSALSKPRFQEIIVKGQYLERPRPTYIIPSLRSLMREMAIIDPYYQRLHQILFEEASQLVPFGNSRFMLYKNSLDRNIRSALEQFP